MKENKIILRPYWFETQVTILIGALIVTGVFCVLYFIGAINIYEILYPLGFFCILYLSLLIVFKFNNKYSKIIITENGIEILNKAKSSYTWKDIKNVEVNKFCIDGSDGLTYMLRPFMKKYYKVYINGGKELIVFILSKQQLDLLKSFTSILTNNS